MTSLPATVAAPSLLFGRVGARQGSARRSTGGAAPMGIDGVQAESLWLQGSSGQVHRLIHVPEPQMTYSRGPGAERSRGPCQQPAKAGHGPRRHRTHPIQGGHPPTPSKPRAARPHRGQRACHHVEERPQRLHPEALPRLGDRALSGDLPTHTPRDAVPEAFGQLTRHLSVGRSTAERHGQDEVHRHTRGQEALALLLATVLGDGPIHIGAGGNSRLREPRAIRSALPRPAGSCSSCIPT